MEFMNIEIDNISFNEAVDACCSMAASGIPGHYVVTPNVDHIVRLESDEELKKAYENADLVLADGQPLLWMAKLYGYPIIEKVSGSDLFPALCEACAKRGLSMFLFGAGPGVAQKAADSLKKRYGKLNIVGVYSPEYGFEKSEESLAESIELINAANPDVLVVGLGCPKQEKFIYENRKKLNCRLSLGLGASLDFEACNVKRAPKFLSDHGFEWLFRMIQDPKRLTKRYWNDLIHILPLFFKYHPDRKKNGSRK